MRRTISIGLGLLALVACGCHRGPLPSESAASCESSCESLACFNPELGAEGVEQCESHCHEKVDLSREQGASCEQAFTNAMACLGELSCDGYSQWLTQAPDAPCPDSRSEVASACQGLYLEPYILPP